MLILPSAPSNMYMYTESPPFPPQFYHGGGERGKNRAVISGGEKDDWYAIPGKAGGHGPHPERSGGTAVRGPDDDRPGGDRDENAVGHAGEAGGGAVRLHHGQPHFWGRGAGQRMKGQVGQAGPHNMKQIPKEAVL